MLVNLLDDIQLGVLRQMAVQHAYEIYDHTAATYGRSHRRWLRHAGGEAQCAFEGAVAALLRPGTKMLDAACGTGTVVRRLLKSASGGAELVLLDASQRMLDQCDDIPSTRIKGCMMDLPFAADQFDLVTCAWGIETLPDPHFALDEFVRVTRPGGHICLVFCADRPSSSLVSQALRHNIIRSGRGTFLDHHNMAQMARNAGVQHVQMLHCTGPAAAMILHI